MMLLACPVAGKQKAVDICNAFIAGAPKDVFGYVFYGVNASNKRNFEIAKNSGESWYYIDNSYFDKTRGTHFRVTRNALQHTGSGDTDFARFNALGLEIKPWRENPDGHIVVCPQSDDFMRNVAGYSGDWLQTTLREMGSRFPRRHVCVRLWSADKLALARTLAADLEGAWALATHSSAAAIAAVLAGVKVFTHSSCAAHMNGPTSLAHNATRHHWAGVLADNQFTLDEMKKGVAWRALHP